MQSTLGSVGHTVWHFDKAWQSEKRGKGEAEKWWEGAAGAERRRDPVRHWEGAGLCSMFALTGGPEPTQREARWSR